MYVSGGAPRGRDQRRRRSRFHHRPCVSVGLTRGGYAGEAAGDFDLFHLKLWSCDEVMQRIDRTWTTSGLIHTTGCPASRLGPSSLANLSLAAASLCARAYLMRVRLLSALALRIRLRARRRIGRRGRPGAQGPLYEQYVVARPRLRGARREEHVPRVRAPSVRPGLE